MCVGFHGDQGCRAGSSGGLTKKEDEECSTRIVNAEEEGRKAQ